MNIFATSSCPRESARAIDKMRVNKMHLESCQMLSTAVRVLSSSRIETLGYVYQTWHTPNVLKRHNKPQQIRVLDTEKWTTDPSKVGDDRKIPLLQIYQDAYVNHPCTVWARKSIDNFWWLAEHCVELLSLHERYYGHKAESDTLILNRCLQLVTSIPHSKWPEVGLTPFANCTIIKQEPRPNFSVHRMYQHHLNSKWQNETPVWKDGRPEWLNTL